MFNLLFTGGRRHQSMGSRGWNSGTTKIHSCVCVSQLNLDLNVVGSRPLLVNTTFWTLTSGKRIHLQGNMNDKKKSVSCPIPPHSSVEIEPAEKEVQVRQQTVLVGFSSVFCWFCLVYATLIFLSIIKANIGSSCVFLSPELLTVTYDLTLTDLFKFLHGIYWIYVFDHWTHIIIDDAFLDFSVAVTFPSSTEHYTVGTGVLPVAQIYDRGILFIYLFIFFFPTCMIRGFGSFTALLNNIIFPPSSLREHPGWHNKSSTPRCRVESNPSKSPSFNKLIYCSSV